MILNSLFRIHYETMFITTKIKHYVIKILEHMFEMKQIQWIFTNLKEFLFIC